MSRKEMRRCVGCRKTIRANLSPIMCTQCNDFYHGTCSELPKAVRELIKEDPVTKLWTCKICQRKMERTADLARKLSFEEEVDEVSANMNTTCKSSLRVLQWNAEAISTKMFDLSRRLVEDDIDVCVVQETHL